MAGRRSYLDEFNGAHILFLETVQVRFIVHLSLSLSLVREAKESNKTKRGVTQPPPGITRVFDSFFLSFFFFFPSRVWFLQ